MAAGLQSSSTLGYPLVMIWGIGSVGAAIGESTGESALDAVRLRLVASFVEESAADQARHAIGRASAGLAGLFDVDVSALDAVELRVWLEEVEGLRRTAEAAAVAADDGQHADR